MNQFCIFNREEQFLHFNSLCTIFSVSNLIFFLMQTCLILIARYLPRPAWKKKYIDSVLQNICNKYKIIHVYCIYCTMKYKINMFLLFFKCNKQCTNCSNKELLDSVLQHYTPLRTNTICQVENQNVCIFYNKYFVLLVK